MAANRDRRRFAEENKYRIMLKMGFYGAFYRSFYLLLSFYAFKQYKPQAVALNLRWMYHQEK